MRPIHFHSLAPPRPYCARPSNRPSWKPNRYDPATIAECECRRHDPAGSAWQRCGGIYARTSWSSTRPLSTCSHAGCAAAAVQASLISDSLQLPFVLLVRFASRSRKDRIIGIVVALVFFVDLQFSHQGCRNRDLALLFIFWLESPLGFSGDTNNMIAKIDIPPGRVPDLFCPAFPSGDKTETAFSLPAGKQRKTSSALPAHRSSEWGSHISANRACAAIPLCRST
jgi:hypothetical protein